MELQSLGRETASVRLMGRLKGTLPVRMRQAQSAPVRTISASTPQHCFVGEPPPLVLPVTKLRHGVNVDISDAVHDVATCPDAGAAATSSSSSATAAAAGEGSNLSRRLVIRQDTPAPLESGFRKGREVFLEWSFSRGSQAKCSEGTVLSCSWTWCVYIGTVSQVLDGDWVELVARNRAVTLTHGS